MPERFSLILYHNSRKKAKKKLPGKAPAVFVCLLMQPEQGLCYPLVQQHRQHGDDRAFQQVQGATHSSTKVETLLTPPRMAVPMAMMVSRGMPYSWANFGRR